MADEGEHISLGGGDDVESFLDIDNNNNNDNNK